VTSLSESSQGEVGDNREKWGDFWEKSIGIRNSLWANVEEQTMVIGEKILTSIN
jgi:hypothetical protein